MIDQLRIQGTHLQEHRSCEEITLLAPDSGVDDEGIIPADTWGRVPPVFSDHWSPHQSCHC